MINKSDDNILRAFWLYLLDNLDLPANEYWYLRGMLDVCLPEENVPRLNSPLVEYLYKIKVSKKGEL